jgi:cytosine/adenosine deaminase-related metal-dependent hydrolase
VNVLITKIKGKYVIAYDGKSHVIIENGEVVFKDDTIIYVGKNYEGKFDEYIEEMSSIISPGFIDLDALGDIDHALIFNEVNPDKRKNLYWSEEYFDSFRKEYMTE